MQDKKHKQSELVERKYRNIFGREEIQEYNCHAIKRIR